MARRMSVLNVIVCTLSLPASLLVNFELVVVDAEHAAFSTREAAFVQHRVDMLSKSEKRHDMT